MAKGGFSHNVKIYEHQDNMADRQGEEVGKFFSITPGFHKAVSNSRLNQSHGTAKVQVLYDHNFYCFFSNNCPCRMQALFGVRFYCRTPSNWQSTTLAYCSIRSQVIYISCYYYYICQVVKMHHKFLILYQTYVHLYDVISLA